MADLDQDALELADRVAQFGLDAVDLDMLKRGDMLGSIGAKVFHALSALSPVVAAPVEASLWRHKTQAGPFTYTATAALAEIWKAQGIAVQSFYSADSINTLTAERDEARVLAAKLLKAGQEDLALLEQTGEAMKSLRIRSETAEARISALSAASLPHSRDDVVGVRVKPLVWEKSASGKDEFANTICGQYAVGLVNGAYLATVRFIGDDAQWNDNVIVRGICAKKDAKAVAQADYEQRILSALEAAQLPIDRAGGHDDETFPTLSEAYSQAVKAAQSFEDAAHVEETNWTGWGEQIVPPHATMRRVKAQQAVSALRDADPSKFRALSDKEPTNV